ncbi:hypothetical protein GIB67_032119 [Kingdonia uniflora]|uniref:Uncharacterized protein n=1 Tax=Kingdonia uniflora TaxID=39325 RepID=A0A7J7MXC4_9MAGN|nr:hypothetical protein GIB67_032119 [Kingdonia uniflora]
MHTHRVSRQRLINEGIEAFEGSITGRTPMDEGSDLVVLDIVTDVPLAMVLPAGRVLMIRCRKMVDYDDSDEEEIGGRERGEGNAGHSGGKKGKVG